MICLFTGKHADNISRSADFYNSLKKAENETNQQKTGQYQVVHGNIHIYVLSLANTQCNQFNICRYVITSQHSCIYLTLPLPYTPINLS